MWTVEYKATERGPWVPTGITADDADDAWRVFTMLIVADDVPGDYYAAQAFGPPASLASASLAGVTRKC